MSADKRTVTTDALETLGTIISENEKRDAIHLAVEPVVAKETLRAGQDVNAKGEAQRPYVGIVDPFLKAPVQAGERFWLVVYPRQITSLRHVWDHPSFSKVEEVRLPTPEEAEARLREITKEWDGPGYDTFLEVATTGSAGFNNDDDDYGSYSIEGEYLLSIGRDAGGEIPPEVWTLVEIITGKTVVGRPSYFSCSC